jgi:hypothetical protein
MSQKNNNDHKIWVDVQVEWNRLLQAMIDSEAINNYILQQVRNAKTNTAMSIKVYADIYNQWRIQVNNRPFTLKSWY